jgi:eukaryotic-like serine/threonine-protein kinase
MLKERLASLWEKRLFRHLVLGVLAFFGFILLISLFLRFFTHHGEALVLPDYTGEYVEMVENDAKKRSFQLVVVDSVFVLGKNGGLILAQNPLPGERVKRRRKIYLTVTKSKADEVLSGRLPVLYGKSYERKSRELKQGFEIFSKVAGYRFDPGPEGYILAVIYDGDTIVSSSIRKTDVMIEKGATLEMILSKSTGAQIDLPNLVCKSYAEARFLCLSLKLNMVDMDNEAGLESRSSGYIHAQDPPFYPGASILMGDTIRVAFKPTKPDYCDN